MAIETEIKNVNSFSDPNYINNRLKKVFDVVSIEIVTGFIGYGFIANGFIEHDFKVGLVGYTISSLSGSYCIYKELVKSDIKLNSKIKDITDKF